jgi:hypothetical protein
VTHRPTHQGHLTGRTHRVATAAAAAGLLAAVLSPAATAGADVASFDDFDDTGLGVDIVSVRVANEAKVRVRTQHADLRPSYADSVTIYLDTDARRRGPEYGLHGLLSADRDWQIVTVRRWRARRLVVCPVDLRVNYLRDVTVGVIHRDCLGGYAGRIRVTVQAGHGQSAGDWGPRGARQFSDWVPR